MYHRLLIFSCGFRLLLTDHSCDTEQHFFTMCSQGTGIDILQKSQFEKQKTKNIFFSENGGESKRKQHSLLRIFNSNSINFKSLREESSMQLLPNCLIREPFVCVTSCRTLCSKKYTSGNCSPSLKIIHIIFCQRCQLSVQTLDFLNLLFE